MFIAHLPAGYLLGCTFRSCQAKLVMFAALLGSVFPDFDLFVVFLSGRRSSASPPYVLDTLSPPLGQLERFSRDLGFVPEVFFGRLGDSGIQFERSSPPCPGFFCRGYSVVCSFFSQAVCHVPHSLRLQAVVVEFYPELVLSSGVGDHRLCRHRVPSAQVSEKRKLGNICGT